jgi:predicted nucleotidyltransferase
MVVLVMWTLRTWQKNAMKTKQEIITTLRASKTYLTQTFGIQRIGLFGSYTNGTATEKSDIDLMFELVDGKHLKVAEYEALEEFCSQLLATPKIDLVNARYMNPIIHFQMQRAVEYI